MDQYIIHYNLVYMYVMYFDTLLTPDLWIKFFKLSFFENSTFYIFHLGLFWVEFAK